MPVPYHKAEGASDMIHREEVSGAERDGLGLVPEHAVRLDMHGGRGAELVYSFIPPP